MEAAITTVPGYAELERIVRADLHLMDLLCTARDINLRSAAWSRAAFISQFGTC
jgi:hypothetical protein